MRRSHGSSTTPGLALGSPVVLAVAVLGGLAFARWRMTDAPPPLQTPSTHHLDAGSWVLAVAPSLRSAGCASAACHGGTAPMHLHAAPGAASEAAEDLAAVAPFTAGPTPLQSPLWLRAVDPSHARSPAFGEGTCARSMLEGWLRGAVVRSCRP